MAVLIEYPITETEYGLAALRDSEARGEYPLGSSLAVYDGMRAIVSALVVYTDLGITTLMAREIERAEEEGITIVYRSLFTGEAPLPVEVSPNKPLTTSHAVDTVHV
jgi:hypothetical protein